MTQRLYPPEIEPLDEPAWNRIEDRLFAQLAIETAPAQAEAAAPQAPARRGFPAARVAAALAAVAAVVVGIWVVRSPGPAGEPSRVVTAGSPAQVTVARAAVTVAADSAVLVQSDSQEAVLLLETGSVYCRVPARRSGETFTVRAGDATVSVVGTAFAVTRDGNGAIVEVDEGIVEIVAGGRSHRVNAGERWPPVQTAAAEPATAEPTEPAPPSEPAVAPAPPARARHRTPRPAAVARTPEEPAAAPPPSDQDRYQQAARLEPTDPDAAVAIYRRLAQAGGRWAAPALYAHARLQLERGRTAEARKLLQHYLRRYPRGANAADARDLLAR